MTRSNAASVLLLALLAGACAPARAVAAPAVSERMEYFDVSGATAHEIRAELDRLGPRGANGRRFDAYTTWFVAWRYTSRAVPRGCAIGTVSVTVKATIAFPRLKADAATPPALKQAFGGYLDKLLLHEKGHVQNAVTVGNGIEAGLYALPPQLDCAALDRAANGLGHAFIREGNRRDLDYDARTNHGATQGARFP